MSRVPSEEVCRALRSLSTENLRAMKLSYAYARSESYEHRIFVLIDRILLNRERVIHFT